MRWSQHHLDPPDFENLLTLSDGVGPEFVEAFDLPAPFPERTVPEPAPAAPLAEHRAVPADAFPARQLGPFRAYWRESTFLRGVGLRHTRCVAALRELANQGRRQGVIELEPGELVVPPELGEHSVRSVVAARLRRSPPWSPAVPMELELIPWSEILPTTWLALCPRRRVHPNRRYFRAGHALLDRLTAELLLRSG